MLLWISLRWVACVKCGWNEGGLIYSFCCGVFDGGMKGIMTVIGGLNFVRKWWLKRDFEKGNEMSPKCPNGQFLKLSTRADSSSLEQAPSRGQLARANRWLAQGSLTRASPLERTKRTPHRSLPAWEDQRLSVRPRAVLGTCKWCFNVWERSIWGPNAMVRPGKW